MPHRCATCQAFYPKPEEIDYEDELEKAQARIEKLEAENKQLRSAGGWNTLLEGKVKPLRDVIDAIKAKWFEIVENGKTNEQICNDFDAFLFPDQP
jgi:predicted nuclease with TOPRIM domain